MTHCVLGGFLVDVFYYILIPWKIANTPMTGTRVCSEEQAATAGKLGPSLVCRLRATHTSSILLQRRWCCPGNLLKLVSVKVSIQLPLSTPDSFSSAQLTGWSPHVSGIPYSRPCLCPKGKGPETGAVWIKLTIWKRWCLTTFCLQKEWFQMASLGRWLWISGAYL